MTSIAWFIYLSNVVENVGWLLSFIICFTAVSWGFLNASVPITDGDVLKWPDFKKWWTRGAATLLISGFVYALVPNKNTMYAIAAAEIGERVSQNGTVQDIASDATKALQGWIKKQIEPAAKSKQGDAQ